MFGKNLYKIMQAQRLTGKELSRMSGIAPSTISKFLSGDQEPGYSQIVSIAEAIQLPPDVFMSVVNPQLTPESPMINEFCMVREIYNDAYSHVHITYFYAFKKFTIEIPVVNDEALYVVVILEGGTDSKLGPLRAGDFRVIKGIDYKGVKVTVHKGTKNIVLIMHESVGDTFRSWSKTFFESIEQQKKEF